MSVDPTTIVSMIEQCVKIYEYIEAVKASSEERRRFMQEVATLRDVLVNLQGLLQDQDFTQDRSLMAPLALLFDPTKPFVKVMEKDLQDLMEKLRRGMDKHRSGWRSLWTKIVAGVIWPLDKTESDALFVRVEHHKSLISLAMVHDVDQLVREMFNMVVDGSVNMCEVKEAVPDLKANIKAIRVAIDIDERFKVANWISRVSFSALHAENSRKWLPGTGKWVLAHPTFQKWESRTLQSSTLWCYGDAGTGKSVIAAMIVEHLRNDADNVVLVIVCRHNKDQQYLRETHAFMCCLLRQLLQLEQSVKVPADLWALYRKDIHPSEDSVRTFLIEAARIVSRPIFIVLDALDECPLGFELVAAIQRLGNNFTLLITSRHVFTQIDDYPSLRIRAPDCDLLTLVDNKIPALPYVREDKGLQAVVRRDIVAQAKGMFLLASLKLWELEHNVTSKVHVEQVLSSVAGSLDDAYDQIFGRIRAQSANRQKLALQAIMIVYNLNPFHIDSSVIEQVLDFEASRPELGIQGNRASSWLSIMHACNGLLTTVSSDEFVAFTHYSALEYIHRNEASLFRENSFQFTLSLCTTFLCYPNFNPPFYVQTSLRYAWEGTLGRMDYWRPDLIAKALSCGNLSYQKVARESSSPLETAACLGLPWTFRLIKETMVPSPNMHQFLRAGGSMISRGFWGLARDLWRQKEFDFNALDPRRPTGCTFACNCLIVDELPEDFIREVLFHPDTSLRCVRHDWLLGGVVANLRGFQLYQSTSIRLLLKRHHRNTHYEPGRSSIYSGRPYHTLPRPPITILDVIAVFLQRADIDLDARITFMLPPEILLQCLSRPWLIQELWGFQMYEDFLRPYARRPPDISAPMCIPSTTALGDLACAVSASDTYPIPTLYPADAADHVSAESLEMRDHPDAVQAVEVMDVRCATATLLAGAIISSLLSLWGLSELRSLS